jgi:hypothetical protein
MPWKQSGLEMVPPIWQKLYWSLYSQVDSVQISGFVNLVGGVLWVETDRFYVEEIAKNISRSTLKARWEDSLRVYPIIWEWRGGVSDEGTRQ